MNFRSDAQRKAVFARFSNSFAKKKFYHGSAGFRGRVIGADGLVPPSKIDMPSSKDEMRGPEFDEYVFLTTDKDLAKTHAERRARFWEDTEYGPIVWQVELDESEVVPDTFDPVRYPDSFKYKGVIPSNKLKKVKFSEEPEESEWLMKHRKELEEHDKMILDLKINSYKDDLSLPVELYSVIANDEDKLLNLKVNADTKDEIYESNRGALYGSGAGRTSGAQLRSRDMAYRKYSDLVDDLLKNNEIEDPVHSNFLRIDRYLKAEAHRNGLKKHEYFNDIPDDIL